MGDVEADNLKKILTVLKTSEVSETKMFALECLLGTYENFINPTFSAAFLYRFA